MPVEFEQNSIREWLLETQESSTIEDTAEHGCAGGTVSELIYYADTESFYKKYCEEIWDRLSNMADDLGCDSILHLIVTFNGSKEVGSDLQLRNLLAWWACEDVCREIIAEKDDEERATA
tara:strand:+ start:831 stop:1190 length:360 start_codon:yes stop_codon:yes gene_type:complete